MPRLSPLLCVLLAGCLPSLEADCEAGGCPTEQRCLAGVCVAGDEPEPDVNEADGAALDGGADARLDGSVPDGATSDGTIADGSIADGSIADRRTPDGSPPDGVSPDGPVPDGPLPDAAPPPSCEVVEGARWAPEQPAEWIAVADPGGLSVAWSDGTDTLRAFQVGAEAPTVRAFPGVRFVEVLHGADRNGGPWLGGVARRQNPLPAQPAMAIVASSGDFQSSHWFEEPGNRGALLSGASMYFHEGVVWVTAVQEISLGERSVVSRLEPVGRGLPGRLLAVSDAGEVPAPPLLRPGAGGADAFLSLVEDPASTRLIRVRQEVVAGQLMGAGGSSLVVEGRVYAQAVVAGRWFVLARRGDATWLLSMPVTDNVRRQRDAEVDVSRVGLGSATAVVASPVGPLVVGDGGYQAVRDGRVFGEPFGLELPGEAGSLEVRWANGPLVGARRADGAVTVDRLDCR